MIARSLAYKTTLRMAREQFEWEQGLVEIGISVGSEWKQDLVGCKKVESGWKQGLVDLDLEAST